MVKFKTTLNKKATKDVNRFGMKKMLWFFIVLSVISLILGLILVTAKPDSETGVNDAFVDGVFMLIMGVGLIPFTYGLTALIQKIQNKSMSLMSDETVSEFIFENGRVTIIQTKGTSFKGTNESDYTIFHKAIETKESFLLYISTMQCHVIPKKDIIEGTIEELKEELTNNLPPKKLKLLKVR